jgi:hypothetical protein
MSVQNLLCKLRGHKRDSSRVWHDGLDFRSRCKRCSIPMLRDLHGWRSYDSADDNEAGRQQRRMRQKVASR